MCPNFAKYKHQVAVIPETICHCEALIFSAYGLAQWVKTPSDTDSQQQIFIVGSMHVL